MNTRYETEHLFLRICSKADAPNILKFYQKNMDDFAHYEPIDKKSCGTLRFHEALLKVEAEHFSDGRMVRFYLFEKHDPFTVVGTVAFHDIVLGSQRCCRTGYKVDRDYRRKGYAYEALELGTRLMFEEKHLHRIEAIVLPDNQASIGLLEKVGFEWEGVLVEKVQLEGVWRNHLGYAMINR